jgi:chaperonin cofactor prefoldin
MKKKSLPRRRSLRRALSFTEVWYNVRACIYNLNKPDRATFKEGRRMNEYGNDGGGKDNKILFISLGVLCVIFLGVTSFVWSSVNRQNLGLANTVSALESQIKTLKASLGEAPSSGAGHDVDALQKEVRNLNAQVGQFQTDLGNALAAVKAVEEKYESRVNALEADLASVAGEGAKVQARLREAAAQSLAFQKELLAHLESLTAAQEKHLSGEQ